MKYIDSLNYDGGTNFASLKALADTQYKGMTLFFTDGVNTYINDIPEFGINSAAVISGKVYDTNAMNSICGGQVYHVNSLSAEEIYKLLKTPQPTVSVVAGNNITDVEMLQEHEKKVRHLIWWLFCLHRINFMIVITMC